MCFVTQSCICWLDAEKVQAGSPREGHVICSHPGKKNDHRDHRLVLHNDDISLRFIRQVRLENDKRIELFFKF